MATTYSHVLWEEKKVLKFSSVAFFVRLRVIVTKGSYEGERGCGEREREGGGERNGRVRVWRREEERGRRREGGGERRGRGGGGWEGDYVFESVY